MIETVMFFAIGFLVASLLGLVMLPLIHNRAVRLTTRRLEAATPVSLAEIQADKDQLRAEFAMSTRRLELSVEQMRARTTGQLAEIGKKSDAIARLKAQLDEKTAAVFALEAREKTLREQIATSEGELSTKQTSLKAAKSGLADAEAAIAQAGNSSLGSDEQRIELASLRTQVEALKSNVAEREREAKALEAKLASQRDEAAQASGLLQGENGKAASLIERVAELEKTLADQSAASDAMSRRAQELQERLSAQMITLSEREFELNQARDARTAAEGRANAMRSEFADVESRIDEATKGLRAEKQQAEAQLAQVLVEQERLQHELAALKRGADKTWADERMENAKLRERINDIAAEIAQMTMTLEGDASPIATILANSAPTTVPEQVGATAPDAGARRGGIADRIRALQSQAGRTRSQPAA